MTTHNAQTALRMLEEIKTSPERYAAASALVHAELETAAQIERIADIAQSLKNVIDGGIAGLEELLKLPLVAGMVNTGMEKLLKPPFDPNAN